MLWTFIFPQGGYTIGMSLELFPHEPIGEHDPKPAAETESALDKKPMTLTPEEMDELYKKDGRDKWYQQ